MYMSAVPYVAFLLESPNESKTMRASFTGLIFAAVITSAMPCVADSPYHLESRREWTIIASGAALCTGAFIWIGQVDALTPEELAALDPAGINSFDYNGMHPYRVEDAADLVTAGTYLLPLAVLADGDSRANWKTIGVMWTEALLWNFGINGLVKAAVLRPRPYAYFPDTPADKLDSSSARFSFYSGHTSGAALNCVFVARILSDQIDNRAAKVALWTGAAAIPAAVAFGRVDSGNHFRTDVITGYAVGAAIGWLVPQLHRHSPERVSLRPALTRGGSALELTVAF